MKRIHVTIEQAHEVKSCKTCNHCSKPSVYQASGWECKAPENILEPRVINMISGDWVYWNVLCTDAKMQCTPGNWYTVDPYLPISGIRAIDTQRYSTPSLRASLTKTTVEDL